MRMPWPVCMGVARHAGHALSEAGIAIYTALAMAAAASCSSAQQPASELEGRGRGSRAATAVARRIMRIITY